MISEVHYMLGRFLKNCDVDQMVNNLVCLFVWPPLVLSACKTVVTTTRKRKSRKIKLLG